MTLYMFHFDLNLRKPDFVACKQLRRRQACVYAWTDQRLFYLFSVKHNRSTCYMQNFNFLAGRCSLADRTESYSVGYPKDILT